MPSPQLGAVVPYRMRLCDQLVGEKIADSDAKRTSEPQQMEGRAVANAPLDAAHVAASDVSDVSERFLGQLPPFPQFADTGAESLEGRVFGGLPSLSRHSPDAARSCSRGPRPIGYNELDACVSLLHDVARVSVRS